MPPLAHQGPPLYPARMASAVLRLLALVALIFMPLSMASAPASAQPVAAAPAGHCEDQQEPADAPSSAKMHCTGCAALPAVDAPDPMAELRPETPLLISFARFMDGVEPETATPPPRIS